MSLLSVKDLRTYFHTRNGVYRAVDRVSFDLERGETLGIVGESGSGKSVTCYSLMGVIPQPPGRIESGSAMFDGVDLLNCSTKASGGIRGKRISMIFQDPMTSLNPYMRISDQLIGPLLIHEKISKALSVDIYFAHPYSSWERGLNENTNGLLRQYFPKNTDLKQVSQEEVDAAVERLNSRPRKSLEFKTPIQLMERLINKRSC